VWPRFAKHFVDDYRIVIPDLAGHGDTGFDASWDYSGPAQAKRVAALMDALGIEKAHITGNSMGGFITGWFAVLFPEKTITAAPMDPGGVASPIPSDMEKMLAEGKNPFSVESVEDFKRFYPMTMAKPPFLPPSVLAAMAEQYMARKPELEAIFPYLHGRDGLLPELPKVELPLMVIWGDHDRLLHVSAGQVWVDAAPNAKLHIFEGIGHMPMVEIPAQTADVYRTFISAE
jgi:pimeloyl-ACP methyl ester carboxylesterase